MYKLPAGSVALVTGAAQGIGCATARAFAEAGAGTVVVADIDRARGESVVAELRKLAPGSFFHQTDVSNEAQVDALFEAVRAGVGRLDYAVNNAGIDGDLGLIEVQTTSNFDRLFGIDVRGMFFCLRREVAVMKKQGSGVIVNIASIAGHVGFAGTAVYTAAKHAALGLTKAAALETARHGVRVCAISPGAVDTPMTDRFTGYDEQAKLAMIAGVPLGRLCKPEEIARGALWLCSPDAALMVGQTLNLDGGWANVKA